MTWDEIVTVLGPDVAAQYRQLGADLGPLTPEQRTIAAQVLSETSSAQPDAA